MGITIGDRVIINKRKTHQSWYSKEIYTIEIAPPDEISTAVIILDRKILIFYLNISYFLL
jgi:hypothetical protein